VDTTVESSFVDFVCIAFISSGLVLVMFRIFPFVGMTISFTSICVWIIYYIHLFIKTRKQLRSK
jgi:hypothetical protein